MDIFTNHSVMWCKKIPWDQLKEHWANVREHTHTRCPKFVWSSSCAVQQYAVCVISDSVNVALCAAFQNIFSLYCPSTGDFPQISLHEADSIIKNTASAAGVGKNVKCTEICHLMRQGHFNLWHRHGAPPGTLGPLKRNLTGPLLKLLYCFI